MLLHQDESDGAYPTLCALRDSVQRSGGANAHGSVRRSIIVACAGYAFHCSQKIYNMVKVRACMCACACVCRGGSRARIHVPSATWPKHVLRSQHLSLSKRSHSIQGLHCSASESEYILFLDDDVAIYPHTIQTLLDILSSDPDLFMVTGWPYDVLPSNSMPVACLCRIVYRWFSMFPLTKQRVP